jgi:hypothetical protein
MDERLLSLLFLLMAGVLPLRGLTAQWAERPDRRGLVRALWAIYLLAAVVAVAALVWRRPDDPPPPRPSGPEQLVQAPVFGPALHLQALKACTLGHALA